MTVAIHDSDYGFHPRWIAYCKREGIPYKLVDCRNNDVVSQLRNCKALFWHHSHSNSKDLLIARQVLSAVEHAGIRVFPDFRTAWHFDDKVAQKYLFESLGIPAVPSHVFVDKAAALEWVDTADFPKVFKLRRGAGSSSVRLVETARDARSLIRRAFGSGIPVYDPWGSLKDRFGKVMRRAQPPVSILKGALRLFRAPDYARTLGKERGYVYFQDFMAGNDTDTRVIVIGDKAFAIERKVRPGDFRASGSGLISHSRESVDERCVQQAFEAAEKIGGECLAFDFVLGPANDPLIVEVSYGFDQNGYEECPGYWDQSMVWKPGPFNPQEWMIDIVLKGNAP
jgi:glutathione synthase/RimK-type ligase-like ATP-grasp enzyme